jgi:hypothetical protein
MHSETTHARHPRSRQRRDENSPPPSSSQHSPHRGHSHQGRRSKSVQQHQPPKKNSPHKTTVPKSTNTDFDWKLYETSCVFADHAFRRICKDYKESSDRTTLETFDGSKAILQQKLGSYETFEESLKSVLDPTDPKMKAHNNVIETLRQVLDQTNRKRTIRYLNQLESDSGRLIFQFEDAEW